MVKTECIFLPIEVKYLSSTKNPLDDNFVRFLAVIAAGILLNLGLFFVLALFAPLVVGIVCGYILSHKRNGILSATLSAGFSYSLIFIVTGFSSDMPAFVAAVLIMCIIAALGGYIGAIVQKRLLDSSPQVSTTIRPGE